MKKCPYCAEKIQDEAIVCRYCGRDLPKESIEQKSKQNKTSVWRHGAIVSGVLSVLYIIAELVNSPLLKLNEQPSPLVFRAMLQDLLFHLIIGLAFNFIVIGLLAAGSFALWRKFGVVPFLIISVIGIIGYAVITDSNQKAKSQIPPTAISKQPIATNTAESTLQATSTFFRWCPNGGEPISWDLVTSQDYGKTLCVAGTIYKVSEVFNDDWERAKINFDNGSNSFFVFFQGDSTTSTSMPLSESLCVVATGKILITADDIPYMDIYRKDIAVSSILLRPKACNLK